MCGSAIREDGRWQGCVAWRLVRENSNMFHSLPGRGHWKRGWAILCGYLNTLIVIDLAKWLAFSCLRNYTATTIRVLSQYDIATDFCNVLQVWCTMQWKRYCFGPVREIRPNLYICSVTYTTYTPTPKAFRHSRTDSVWNARTWSALVWPCIQLLIHQDVS